MNDTTVSVVAASVGSAATLIGVFTAWLASRGSEKLARHQSEIAAHATAAEWLREVREWASATIDVMSEASYTCKAADDSSENRVETVLSTCRHRISSLIDRGRFFFPNQDPESKGAHKPPAYRGHRHAVLDPLVAVERILGGDASTANFKSRDSAIVQMRREFVSRVQGVLSPQTHNLQIARLIHQSDAARAADPTLGGLLPDRSAVVPGADALLRRGDQRGLWRPLGYSLSPSKVELEF